MIRTGSIQKRGLNLYNSKTESIHDQDRTYTKARTESIFYTIARLNLYMIRTESIQKRGLNLYNSKTESIHDQDMIYTKARTESIQ